MESRSIAIAAKQPGRANRKARSLGILTLFLLLFSTLFVANPVAASPAPAPTEPTPRTQPPTPTPTEPTPAIVNTENLAENAQEATKLEVSFIIPISVKPNDTGLLSNDEINQIVTAGSPQLQLLEFAREHRLMVAVDPYLLRSLMQQNRNPKVAQFIQNLASQRSRLLRMSYGNTPVAALANTPVFLDAAAGSSAALSAVNPDLYQDLLLPKTLWLSQATGVTTALSTDFAASFDSIVLNSQAEKTAASGYYPLLNYQDTPVYLPHAGASQAIDLAAEAYLSGNLDVDLTVRLIIAELEKASPQRQFLLLPNTANAETILILANAMAENSKISLIAARDLKANTTEMLPGKSEQTDPAQATLAGDVSQVLLEDQLVQKFLTALDNPDRASANLRLRALQTLSGNYLASERSTAILAYLNETFELKGTIAIEAGSAVTLITSETNIPINVNNSLASASEVILSITTSNNRMLVPNTMNVKLPGNAKTTVLLPVTALANGKTQISMFLTSPSGVRIGEVQNLSVTIAAQWEQIAVVSFTVVVVLFLVLGIARSILKRRKLTKTADTGSTQ